MIETIKFSEAIRSTFHQMMKKNKNIILIGLGTNDPKGILELPLVYRKVLAQIELLNHLLQKQHSPAFA